MSAQLDLFDARRYPDRPGYKTAGPSKDAARKITSHAATLHERVLAAFKRGPATADEIAKVLDCSVLSIRPRVSELYRQGLIMQTGARRANDSGLAATVWRIVP